MRSGPSASQDGYSLVEVVVAVAIAGTALAGLVQAVGSNLRHAALTNEYTQATALAESMITRVGTDLPLRTGTHRGRFDRTFHWRRTIRAHLEDQAVDPETTTPLLPVEVAVTVWWKNGNQDRQVTLRTIRLKPNYP